MKENEERVQGFSKGFYLCEETLKSKQLIKENIELGWQLTVSEVQSIVTMVGSMAACRQMGCWSSG